MNLTLTNARCDSLNCGSRHCGSKKLLASRLSYKFAISHIHISIYLLYTYIYTYACIKILYVRDIRWNRRACPRIYIYIKVGGGNRVMPKYFSAPFHFRLGDVSARIIEREVSVKHSKKLATIMTGLTLLCKQSFGGGKF